MTPETAKYEVTGLVDVFDEQGQITGQLPIGSIQDVPVEVGSKWVEAGTARLVEEAADETVGETGEADDTGLEDGDDEDNENGTGATGEEEVE